MTERKMAYRKICNTISYAEGVENLFLDVYLVGYKTDGESIIIVLKSTSPEEKILYTAVIDSYEEAGVNVTIDILKYLKIEKPLNLLCWSHPHDDHTLGIKDIIDKYCNKDTRILIPNNILMIQNKFSIECQNVLKYLSEKLSGKMIKNRYDILSSLYPGIKVHSVVVPNTTNTKKYTLTVQAISPYDIIANAQFTHSTIDPNKFSIALLLKMDLVPEMNLLFCSDIENDTIECINQYIEIIPNTYNYIKLPHHASETSTFLMQCLDSTIPSEVACTTTFKNKLPKKDVLDEYNKYIKNVYCTNSKIIGGRIKADDDINEKSNYKFSVNDCGVIKTSYDIFNRSYKIERIENAVKVKNNYIL